ncbi:hypothetical protein LA14_1053 [Lactobacillus acidophilus La-14]|nr:hypothetical protein LA14_1053 [Lactobacillus acidophilus La-14]KRK29037.1 hypothetical protein FC29_GL000738 [Lactobacillus acidophilus DSM 20079 = JCM 1132 = NBRC 13951 = CIP 76.13]
MILAGCKTICPFFTGLTFLGMKKYPSSKKIAIITKNLKNFFIMLNIISLNNEI